MPTAPGVKKYFKIYGRIGYLITFALG